MLSQSHIQNALLHAEVLQDIESSDLTSVIEQFPYCEPLRRLYLKKLHDENDVRFETAVAAHSLYFSNRCWLYFYLYGTEPQKPIDLGTLTPVGDYFGALENAEQQTTLKELAIRLRNARIERHRDAQQTSTTAVNTPPQKAEEPDIQHRDNQLSASTAIQSTPQLATKPECTEENAKQLIREKKYAEALKIFQELNLTNPKKNSYFAPQIKYLETIVKNLI